MDPRDEDELWKEIVEHYGDAPSLEDERPATDPGPVVSEDLFKEYTVPQPEPAPAPSTWEDEGRFVPPPPPPIPVPDPPRMLAWVGLFGAPILLLIALVMGRTLDGIVSVLLVGSFVGGFVYLVKTMPNGPRDPGDDGARL